MKVQKMSVPPLPKGVSFNKEQAEAMCALMRDMDRDFILLAEIQRGVPINRAQRKAIEFAARDRDKQFMAMVNTNKPLTAEAKAALEEMKKKSAME